MTDQSTKTSSHGDATSSREEQQIDNDETSGPYEKVSPYLIQSMVIIALGATIGVAAEMSFTPDSMTGVLTMTAVSTIFVGIVATIVVITKPYLILDVFGNPYNE